MALSDAGVPVSKILIVKAARTAARLCSHGIQPASDIAVAVLSGPPSFVHRSH